MTYDNERHLPTAEFRATLEQNIRLNLHNRAHATVRSSGRAYQYLKQAAVLAVGLLLGVGTQIASAQVQDARQRSELESALQVDRNLAAARLQLAQEEHARVRKAFDAGVLSQQSLLAAANELRRAEVEIARLTLNLAEIRATSSAPRNELWAPVVAGRDYVRERLRLDLSDGQSRLTTAQTALDEAERKARVGAISPAEMVAAREEVARANHSVRILATKVTLRDEFLKSDLRPGQVTLRAQQYEATFDLELSQQLLAVAKERLQLARQNYDVGVGTQLELKRAELQVLEREVEVQRLQAELKKLRP